MFTWWRDVGRPFHRSLADCRETSGREVRRRRSERTRQRSRGQVPGQGRWGRRAQKVSRECRRCRRAEGSRGWASRREEKDARRWRPQLRRPHRRQSWGFVSAGSGQSRRVSRRRRERSRLHQRSRRSRCWWGCWNQHRSLGPERLAQAEPWHGRSQQGIGRLLLTRHRSTSSRVSRADPIKRTIIVIYQSKLSLRRSTIGKLLPYLRCL